jgi:hypothetical protein
MMQREKRQQKGVLKHDYFDQREQSVKNAFLIRFHPMTVASEQVNN